MTTLETVEFFASLRGVQPDKLTAYSRACLKSADLSSQEFKRSRELSGGNKRKLQMAIAICGEPQFTVLDECSAGIDPVARRRLWTVVKSLLSKGNSVVMTTHHIEEANALGQRVAIMDKGRLACLGSPQYLKSKYGNGYELSIKMKKNRGVDEEVLIVVCNLCSKATILERSGTEFVRIAIGVSGKDFSLIKLFQELEKSKKPLGISSYSVKQSDLEEVFLKLTSQGIVNNSE